MLCMIVGDMENVVVAQSSRWGFAMTCRDAFLVTSLIGASTIPFVSCGWTSTIPFIAPGFCEGFVYHMMAIGLNITAVWLY